MLPLRNIPYLSPMCCNFWEKCTNSHKSGLGCSTPLSKTSKLCWDSYHKIQKYTCSYFTVQDKTPLTCKTTKLSPQNLQCNSSNSTLVDITSKVSILRENLCTVLDSEQITSLSNIQNQEMIQNHCTCADVDVSPMHSPLVHALDEH